MKKEILKCPKCKKTSDEVKIVKNDAGTKYRCIFVEKLGMLRRRKRTEKVDIHSIFYKYLTEEKTKAIDLVRMLGVSAWNTSMHKIVFPLSLFTNKKDVDNIQLAIITAYIINNWDESYEKSEKWWIKFQAKKQKEREGGSNAS